MEEDLVGLDGDEVLDGLQQECRMLQELDELALVPGSTSRTGGFPKLLPLYLMLSQWS